MPETRSPEAWALAERLRSELGRLQTRDGWPVPCSIGVVTFNRPPGSVQEPISAGDELMYEAKHNGKDRIERARRTGSFVPHPGA